MYTYIHSWRTDVVGTVNEYIPIIGSPLITERCPNCGRHTLYMNKFEDEWCFHCDYIFKTWGSYE